MTSKGKHQKHPKLVRSSIGVFHRCEWSIYGTGCSSIEAFYNRINHEIINCRLTYVDADHSSEKIGLTSQNGKKQIFCSTQNFDSEYDDKLSCLSSDAVFINGNHYTASRQIVIIDSNKKDSLKRREDQLTNIDLVIVTESEEEIFDFVKLKMNDKTLVLKKKEWDSIIQHLQENIKSHKAPMKALILAGGKSKRMGIDKASLVYHGGQPQEEHLIDMLEGEGISVYLSKGYDYLLEQKDNKVIVDKLPNMGPFGAILSAMMTDPNVAWLVVACDLPFLDKAHISQLIENRDYGKMATAFRGAGNPFPEPLITIYEPRAYQRFLSFLSLGYACPRKVLINSDVKEIELQDNRVITNVNTQEERDQAISDLKII